MINNFSVKFKIRFPLPWEWITILSIFLSIFIFLGATYEEILNDKNKQIEISKKEIEDSRTLIKNYQTGISNSQKTIDSINVQISILDDFLKDYQNEQFLSPDEIAIETNMALFMEDEVEQIQNSFKSKIINLYKHGKNYELELLMSSKSPNEYLRRNEYLEKFAQSRKKELLDLKTKKFILEQEKKMLSLSTSSKRFYIEAKRSEKEVLASRIKELKNSIEDAQSQVNSNEKRISFKENQVQSIQDYINNFNANKKNFKGNKYSRLNYASDDFASTKGNLNLPVDLGIIRNEFGNYVNNSIGTIINNNGIDFNISKDSKVYAVANGTVTLIGDAPFYGKVIVITHDNDYRTVYASVSDISVNVGDKVKLNQVIAKSGETLEEQGIHFEIWQGKTPQNPKEWIRMQ